MSITPTKDVQTVTASGEQTAKLPDGVRIRPLTTQTDERGTVLELMDERWDWDDEPMVYSYAFTVRPQAVKGWAHHKHHTDRYTLVQGEMLAVLYDDREDSSTRGLLAKVFMTEHHRCILRIPPYVWHAVQNIGERDTLTINFPTQPYNHEHPDKYRLPLDNDLIPYKFQNTLRAGW